MLAKIPFLNRLDPFLVGIVLTVAVAAALPAHGVGLDVFTWASKIAIGLLFFLYGARLSTAEAVAGLRHWRLHATILAVTFVIFPLLGLAAKVFVPWLLTEPLYLGVLYLCLLPSTVQSSIALVSVARGNIPGAVVSASASSLLGILFTPALVAVTMSTQGVTFSSAAVLDIVLMLLVPFVAGQVMRRWIGGWVTAHGKPLKLVDRGSILLVVYVASAVACQLGLGSQPGSVQSSVVGALCIVTLAAAAIVVWHAILRYRQQRQMHDRGFLARIAVGHDAVAALAILWQLMPLLMVPLCR